MLVVTLKVNINSRHYIFIFHQGKKCPNSRSTSRFLSFFFFRSQYGSCFHPCFLLCTRWSHPFHRIQMSHVHLLLEARCPCCPLPLCVVSAGRGALCGTILGRRTPAHSDTTAATLLCVQSQSRHGRQQSRSQELQRGDTSTATHCPALLFLVILTATNCQL